MQRTRDGREIYIPHDDHDQATVENLTPGVSVVAHFVSGRRALVLATWMNPTPTEVNYVQVSYFNQPQDQH